MGRIGENSNGCRACIGQAGRSTGHAQLNSLGKETIIHPFFALRQTHLQPTTALLKYLWFLPLR